MDIITDLLDSMDGPLKQAVINELVNAAKMEEVQSGINHARIGAHNYNNESKAIEGVGRHRLRIDPFHFHYWGKKFKTYDCWKDKGFINDVEKVHPELKVKCGGTRLQVGYSGENKRSTQKYNL